MRKIVAAAAVLLALLAISVPAATQATAAHGVKISRAHGV